MAKEKRAIIVGAGPAGLTAAYELVKKTKIKPIIYELSNDLGGISKTFNYKGNRIDIGGHRFFSKSDTVMNWWQEILPLEIPEKIEDDRITINYHNKQRQFQAKNTTTYSEKAFLLRRRFSSIYYNKKFFEYPITLGIDTFLNLGLIKSIKIVVTYLKSKSLPINPVKSLEDFYINQFGDELYKTFFKSYTEKLWGIEPKHISPEWGKQRVKGVSLTKVLVNAIKSAFKEDGSVNQKHKETSLIQRFLYPKLGPGQLWEEVAEKVIQKGGELYKRHLVTEIIHEKNRIKKIKVRNLDTGDEFYVEGDYFFSTMPVKELIENMTPKVSNKIRQVAKGLEYRDFITVGLLINKLKISNKTKIETYNNLIPDNWLYIHEPNVKMCRIQIFNNWSPYMVSDPEKVWIGLEYVCSDKDDIWKMNDDELLEFGKKEVELIGLADKNEIVDGVILKMPKAYPGYFGTYKDFRKIRDFILNFDNLYLIGRNGMHRYNNQDHSMLTAIASVDHIIKGGDKKSIWDINTEEEYHEEKK